MRRLMRSGQFKRIGVITQTTGIHPRVAYATQAGISSGTLRQTCTAGLYGYHALIYKGFCGG